MGHNVGKQAAAAVAKGNRKQNLETRSADEIIKGIRGNLVAHLSVTPSDIAFLLVAYDATIALVAQSTTVLNMATANDALKNEEIANLKAQVAELEEKVAWARQVYEAENRSGEVAVFLEKGARVPNTVEEVFGHGVDIGGEA